MSDDDPGYQDLLKRIGEARDEGKSMGEMFQMAADFLEAQPETYDAGKRDEHLEQVKFLISQQAIVSSMMEAAESGNEEEGQKQLFTLFANAQAAIPQKEREDRRDKFAAAIKKAEADHKKRMAAHKKERLKRGLSAQARTGKPEAEILIHALPRPDSDYEDKPRRNLGTMIKAIEAAQTKRDNKVMAGIAIGATRIGGLPDLPADTPWPEFKKKKLPFIAQFNLAELPKTAHKLLPADGHLFAFALISNEKGTWPPPVSVFLHRGPAAKLKRAKRPPEKESWPDWTDERVYAILPATTKLSARAKKRTKESDDTLGWLFDTMADVFGTPGEIADASFGDGHDWINLLALYSRGSMQWSDCGHLYFLIRRSALAKLDFSGVICQACST